MMVIIPWLIIIIFLIIDLFIFSSLCYFFESMNIIYLYKNVKIKIPFFVRHKLPMDEQMEPFLLI